MIVFIVVGAIMLAIACAVVLVPLWRQKPADVVDRQASNLSILRDQLAELDADLASGTLSQEQYDQARAEISRRAIDEGSDGEATPLAASRAGARIALIVAAILPLLAVGLYAVLGTPGALDFTRADVAQRTGQHDFSPQQIGEMADKLRAKLEKEPENAEGWAMLGRTYYALSRYLEAATAYEQAIKRMPDNADLLADYADTLGVVQNQSLEGKPLDAINRALQINPRQWKALALAGTAAFDRKDYAAAVSYWERMKESVPPGSEMAQSVDASIKEARDLGGLADAAKQTVPSLASAATPGSDAPKVAMDAPPSGGNAPAAANGNTRVSGSVSLSPGLAAQAKPDDIVFIFARASEGPRMPLAILRKQVKDLPTSFTLEDAMAMSPSMKLSDFPNVVIGARISKTGNAIAQSGDLEGLSAPVKVGATNVGVVIDKRVP
ncbi:MAG TPA: c-type cytochrome biogenesis protein CcmI [Casimicrobiaceae bacterium]|nr:c-type cytochrome biogenesis protein CcmI [Casimicrobiaceae bacterium]